MKLPTLLRPATTDDYSLIIDSWLRTYRKSPYVKGIPSQIYFPSHRELIEHTLERTGAMVAQNKDDAEQIYGYLIIEDIKGMPCIHYVYVKHLFRRFGIANLLMEEVKKADILFYTHSTRVFDKLLKDHFVYNPYLFTSRKDIYAHLEREDLPAHTSRGISWS